MIPPRLSEASLHAARSGTILPTYDRGATRFGIVHIGPGAFHRAHMLYVDTLLHSTSPGPLSAGAQSTTVRDALTRKAAIYMIELGGRSAPRIIARSRSAGRPGYAERAFARLAARDTRLVTLTVTAKVTASTRALILDARDAARPRSATTEFEEHCRASRSAGGE